MTAKKNPAPLDPFGPEYIVVNDTPPRVILARRSPKKPTVYGIVADFDSIGEAERLADRLAEQEDTDGHD